MSNAILPAPLVPVDCDLRGLDYMPLFGNHLFGSEFNAAATDSEWRAALTLWWAAWNQVPAGSLPDDDTALCRLADLGRDVKGWKKLRARALHGFITCSDGRLYHEFICAQALIAWDKRGKERERKAKWRAEQDAKRKGQNADVPRDETGTETGTEQGPDADVPANGKGRDGTGRDIREEEKGPSSDHLPPDTPDDAAASAEESAKAVGLLPTEAVAVFKAMRRLGISDGHASNPLLQALLDAGAQLPEFEAAASKAVDKGAGQAYALSIVEGERQRAAAKAKTLHRGPMPSTQGDDRKSRQLSTAALLTGASQRTPTTQPETIDVESRILPA